MIDYADIIISHQSAQKHGIKNVTLDRPLAIRFQIVFQGLNIKGDDPACLFFTQIADQSMTYLSIRASDQDHFFSHAHPSCSVG